MKSDENPYTRMIIRQKVSILLKNIPQEVWSDRQSQLFTRITGLTHAGLKKNWLGKDGISGTSDDGRLTSCNGFIGWYARNIIPPKRCPGVPFSMFDLEKAAQMSKIPSAWVKQADDLSARPDYGDIVRWNRLHVGVSLDFVGGNWKTIEGGQGGPGSGRDIVKYKEKLYNPGKILGWISMAEIFDA